MCAGRVNVRRVAQTELEIDRRGHPDDLGHFVIADEAAEVVRHFDVEIDGNFDGLPDGAHLGRAQVRGDIQRRNARALKDFGGGGIGGGQA